MIAVLQRGWSAVRGRWYRWRVQLDQTELLPYIDQLSFVVERANRRLEKLEAIGEPWATASPNLAGLEEHFRRDRDHGSRLLCQMVHLYVTLERESEMGSLKELSSRVAKLKHRVGSSSGWGSLADAADAFLASVREREASREVVDSIDDELRARRGDKWRALERAAEALSSEEATAATSSRSET